MGFTLLSAFLTRLIRRGQLIVTDHRGRKHTFGTSDGALPIEITLTDSSVALALAMPSKPTGARFRIDRPGYQALKDAALRQRGFDFRDADELAECHCTD